MHKRRIAVFASITLLAVIGVATAFTLARHGGAATSIGPAGAVAPAPCDEPDGVQPSAYLDWPCAKAADDALGGRLAAVTRGARTFYAGSGTLRMRLLADTRHDGELDPHVATDDTLVEVWYDGSTRAAALVEVSGTVSPGSYETSAYGVPSGDPTLLLRDSDSSPDGRTGARRVFARSDVGSLLFVMGSASTTVPVTDGVATLTFPLSGNGDDGHPHADWEVLPRPVPGAPVRGLFEQVPWDVTYSPPAPEPTPTPTTVLSAASPRYPSGRELCEDPAAEGQHRYLDWPCAAPADSQIQDRVDAILEGLKQSYLSIKTPRVRLLADTRDDGDPAQGPAATEIEVWDTLDPRSAVLAGYRQSDPLQGT